MRAVTIQIMYRYRYMYMYNIIQCTYSMTTMFLNFSWSYTIMRDEKEERKKQARSNKQKRQSNTLKAVTFFKKNELPLVGLEPTTLYTIIHVYTCIYSIPFLLCVCSMWRQCWAGRNRRRSRSQKNCSRLRKTGRWRRNCTSSVWRER